jgi:hypothetical protein
MNSRIIRYSPFTKGPFCSHVDAVGLFHYARDRTETGSLKREAPQVLPRRGLKEARLARVVILSKVNGCVEKLGTEHAFLALSQEKASSI